MQQGRLWFVSSPVQQLGNKAQVFKQKLWFIVSQTTVPMFSLSYPPPSPNSKQERRIAFCSWLSPECNWSPSTSKRVWMVIYNSWSKRESSCGHWEMQGKRWRWLQSLLLLNVSLILLCLTQHQSTLAGLFPLHLPQPSTTFPVGRDPNEL